MSQPDPITAQHAADDQAAAASCHSLEAPMVRLVERRSAASFNERMLRLRVHVRPSDPGLVLGSVTGVFVADAPSTSAVTTPSNVPLDEAFLVALSHCAVLGIPTLWIDDPLNLFPPDKRPSPLATP